MDQVKEEYPTRKILPSGFDEAIDREALAELWEDIDEDEALIRELVALYLEDTPKQIANARQALAIADAKELGRIAHTLKGSSLYYGAKRMSRVCKELESACAQSELAEANGLIKEMAKEFDRVKDALQSMTLKYE
jgi:HPt (histidine-containing phosphotransfer) domain-containing protein